MVHALRPNPWNNIQEGWRILDWFSVHPEGMNLFTYLLGDEGVVFVPPFAVLRIFQLQFFPTAGKQYCSVRGGGGLCLLEVPGGGRLMSAYIKQCDLLCATELKGH